MMQARHWQVAAAVGTAAAGLMLLYFFAPEQHSFYPRCLFLAITRLECPGCGGLRAMHQLLHGHLAAAFHLNPLMIILLPVLCVAAIGRLANASRGRPLVVKPGWLWFLGLAGVVFGVLRNLPGISI